MGQAQWVKSFGYGYSGAGAPNALAMAVGAAGDFALSVNESRVNSPPTDWRLRKFDSSGNPLFEVGLGDKQNQEMSVALMAQAMFSC